MDLKTILQKIQEVIKPSLPAEFTQEFIHIFKKDVLFIIGDWNATVGSQKIPGVTGSFGLGVWNEAGQRPTEFCQENTLVSSNSLNPLPTTQDMILHMDITRWSTPKSD